MLRTLSTRCFRRYSTHTPIKLNFFNVSEHEVKDNIIESTNTKKPTPLVVLHGLFGNAQTFRNILMKEGGILNRGRQAYVLDARNHGLSPHVEAMTYNDMTHDLINFVKHHNLEKCIIMGHSMGGKSLLNLLLHHPEFARQHVEKAVIVDMAPMSYMNHPRWEVRQMLQGLLAVKLDQVKIRKDADDMMKEFIRDTKVRGFLLTNLIRQDGKWKWRFNLDAINNHLSHVGGFPEITATQQVQENTLFVRGASSFYVGERPALDLIEKHFNNYQVRTVSNAGHWVHVDNTSEFERIVQDFIDH
jgi:pimeloyl-ACP methyl ester carboxylesterase